MSITCTRVQNARKGKGNNAIFGIPGNRATIRIAKQAFVNGEIPETLVVDLPEGSAFTSKPTAPKLSKEERKALRDALTPEQKIAAAKEKAKKALDAAAKLEAKLAQPAGH